MSRFPKVSETFILNEILGLERLGLRVEVFPLKREHDTVSHPEAAALVARAHYPPLGAGLLSAQLHWLRRRPRAYARAWARAVAGNLRSPRFLLRALVVVPEAAWFAREMERLGVRHVHAHYATHPALAAYVVHLLTGLPYSITAHAHDIYVERTMLEEKVRAAAFVVAISEYNRTLLADLYGEDVRAKTHVVRTGADLGVFAPPARRPRADAPERPWSVVCVASLQDYKGHPYLIDACALLLDQGVDLRCVCVGEGEDRPQLEAQVRERGVEGRVILAGAQPRQRVAELLAGADAFVLPSVVTASGKMEGVPVALMEALAMETPVVATDISGVSEIVEDGVTGHLVPQRDAAALAGALRRLHDDPAAGEELARAGRRRVLDEFDLDRNVARLHDLLTG
jgi:glycosyltransferase involved in cell wall biosynthesis